MLKQHATILRRTMMLVDAGIVVLSFFLAYEIRLLFGPIQPVSEYFWILPIVTLIWFYFLYVSGMYESFRIKSVREILFTIGNAAFFGLVSFGSFFYIFRLEHTSRLFVFLMFLTATGLIIAEKLFLLRLFRRLRERGYNFRNILIVGTDERARNFIETIDRHSEYGLNIVGVIGQSDLERGAEMDGHPVIGQIEDIPDLLKEYVVDQVFFVVPHQLLNRVEPAVQYCETYGIAVSLAVDYFELKFARASQSEFHGFPMLSFETTPSKVGHLMIKRILNFLLSLAALLVLSPMFLCVGLLIRLTSPGPVFFMQERVGLNGRRFALYKFRTMYADAEERQKELMEHNEMEGPVFKMTNDPRVTPLGRFLRKFSIDELPQLWNVLIGDMSLVGPRPPLPSEVEKYDNWQRRRLSMRPGITCLWQIKGRNRITSFDEWMRLDLQYIDNWSLWLDLKILLQTIPVVVFGIGAK